MKDKNKIRNLVILPLIGILILFLIIVLNQSLQLIKLAASFNYYFGWVVGIMILAVFLMLIIYPVIKIFTMRELPDIPKDENSKEYSSYIDTMHELMIKNSLLKSKEFIFTEDKKSDLVKAFGILDEETDKVIFKEASQVFLTTAISQNGSLDGLFVLKSLMSIIWKIVHMYEARPSIRKLIYIYTNVAGTILVARGIEDLDLIEDQVEPLVASIIGGSVMSVIPGAVPITNLVVSSVMEGSVNALLILRCGCIAQRYMGSLSEPDKKSLRRSASLEAVSKIGVIIRDNTMPIVKSFANATKNAATSIAVPKFKFKNPWAKPQE